jgi:hypothetical protein
MTTTDEVLLIILTTLMSIFFLLCIVAVVFVIKLLKSIRLVVAKAETVVDSVEEVAEVFTEARGPLTLFGIVKNIVKLSQKGRGRK